MKMKKRLIFSLVALTVCVSVHAEVLDRPSGIKIGERMILRPYVTLSFTYDSNVNSFGGASSEGKRGDYMWSISPALWLHYNAETWSTILSGFYNYHQYLQSENRGRNQHNFGEDWRWNWANSTGRDKGWSLVLGQSFQQITMADDLVYDSGARYGGDTRQFQFSGALQRRFNENLHGDVNASYYWLDYAQDGSSQYTFYGWDRILVGGEVGFAPSPWTDFILSGSYQQFNQDNTGASGYDGNSDGYSVQAGIGSYMTDRISYRLLAGWSRFNYSSSDSSSDGFVYTASGNWKIGETWNMMLLGSSYYQPSERQQASRSRVDAISWGLAKMMIRGKLRATFDIRYRRETNEHASESAYDYVLNIWTGRLGVDYSLCRFLSAYANAEYQRSMNDEADSRNGAYDYDRWRLTIGLKVSY